MYTNYSLESLTADNLAFILAIEKFLEIQYAKSIEINEKLLVLSEDNLLITNKPA
jgi:hypothetical protein